MQNKNIETLVKHIEEYKNIGDYLLYQIQLERDRIQYLK